MTRDITSAAITAATGETVRLARLVDADFESGPVRVHDGVGTLTWNGHAYAGVGNYGGVSAVEEDSDLSASKVSFTLSGIDPTLISIALGEQYQGRDITSYVAFLDEAGQIILDPVVEFKGRMDTMNLTLGALAIIELTAVDARADWDRPRIGRWNGADQQARFPGDKGLDFAEQTTEKELRWGG